MAAALRPLPARSHRFHARDSAPPSSAGRTPRTGRDRAGGAKPSRAVPCPGAAGPSGQREGRGTSGSPGSRHGSRPNPAAREAARSPLRSAGNSPRSSMVPVVPPPALLSAPQLSRPAPARARRPRAPVGVARARGCPLPAGARGTPRHGAAGSSGSPRSDLVLGAAEGDEAFPEPAPLRTEPAPSPQPPPTKNKAALPPKLTLCLLRGNPAAGSNFSPCHHSPPALCPGTAARCDSAPSLSSAEVMVRNYRPAGQIASGSESWK